MTLTIQNQNTPYLEKYSIIRLMKWMSEQGLYTMTLLILYPPNLSHILLLYKCIPTHFFEIVFLNVVNKFITEELSQL